jgi:hypothetical protein
VGALTVTRTFTGDDDDSGFGRSVGVLHTFHGTTNRREKKLFARSVNAMVRDIP